MPTLDGLPPPVSSGRDRLTSVVPADRTAELDGLFTRLAAARDRKEAAGIEADIRNRWAESGSATCARSGGLSSG